MDSKGSLLMRIFTPWAFTNKEDEHLFSAHNYQQRQKAVQHLVCVGLIFQFYALLVPGQSDLVFSYCFTVLAIVLDLSLLIVYVCVKIPPIAFSHISWFVIWFQLLVNTSRRVDYTFNELLGWVAIFQYYSMVTLPLHRLMLLAYSILSLSGYNAINYLNAMTLPNGVPDTMTGQLIANIVLLVTMTIMGYVSSIISEKQQRISFKETKRSLQDKISIEQQSKEQERLLLSVLPKHVAVQMRQELGLIDTQFKKIYMSRHENVSILYADIVGFTAISSTYSAQDLVAILNELFARFDRLAEKYQQLRIKILGDCYYCISGAPVEKADHAVLCVHMGLSMVKAIKYVQQTTNSPVDMRVGIHTGAVLAGVLGQRQWQFDVYSRDVELANKMESSGKAGRVHISEVTLNYLSDEFEVEPAYGERREEILRQAGIKTYFIVRVLKPFQPVVVGSNEKCIANDETTLDLRKDSLSELKDDDEESIISPSDDSDDEQLKMFNMLKEELDSRDDDKELKDVLTYRLTFKSDALEKAYYNRPDIYPQALLLLPLLWVFPVIFSSCFNLNISSLYNLDILYIGLILETIILVSVFGKCIFFTMLCGNAHFSKLAYGVLNMFIFGSANIFPLFACGLRGNKQISEDGYFNILNNSECMHLSYQYHICTVLFCGAMWVPSMGGYSRIILIIVIFLVHTFPQLIFPALIEHNIMYQTENYLSNSTANIFLEDLLLPYIYPIYVWRHILMLFLIALTVLMFDRYSESLERARHFRSNRWLVQRSQAEEMRRRNLLLIHNVLPPHVATHFMGKRHHHTHLYSQSYAEVGVLFASMPNFSEFYSEETVNNQGLECLRFLNEVISDFDQLLEDPKYCKDIIKIKTIGSTYMAASGLNPTQQYLPCDNVEKRWAHLGNLVEFALELQRVLAAINEQSFNHFVLRMGVNHGPITAGVIGARKPHYDIWGNTVNVASRMESTGKAGCIQVTEETCEILKKFGYTFEQRGLVAVKGKGQLMTYYLQEKIQDTDNNETLTNGNINAAIKDNIEDCDGPTDPLLKHES